MYIYSFYLLNIYQLFVAPFVNVFFFVIINGFINVNEGNYCILVPITQKVLGVLI